MASELTTQHWSDSETSDHEQHLNTCGLIIRDYAYPAHDDRFSGLHLQASRRESGSGGDGAGNEDDNDDDDGTTAVEWAELNSNGELSLTGLVRALYDFTAENPSELSFKADDLLYIQYKQCAGWFVGYLNGQVGLIPENYVQFIQDS
ncbi:HOG (high osmolarity glycerol) pathway protein [Tieghemiomyces parasiticus]|uniref:HOG (High osmolarity glycerol) pathway protein n=1 Tax=Tieghemiomyces parasiticus TaxID=78921 RepID=A0A9W8DJN2_9FUNG|nr:HOG (high osmolarity glycerol) pathway protein [Tieghemiomyces parasiticus]